MDISIKPVINKLLNAFGLQRAVTEVQKQNIFNGVVMNTFGVSALWQNDGYKDNVNAYTCNSTLYSIVNRISKMGAVAPFKVYKVKAGKKSAHLRLKGWTGPTATDTSVLKAMAMKSLVYEEDNSHPLNELIERLGADFIVNSIGFKLLTGNRFLYVVKLDAGADNGKPYNVFNLPPQYMKIRPDGTPYGVEGYIFEMDRSGNVLPKEDIIHSAYFNPDWQADGSHLFGLSPVRAGSRNLTRSDAALARGVAMLQNAGAAGMMVDKDGNDDKIETVLETKANINRTVSGTSNSGKIGLLNGNWEYINFGLSAVEMEVLASEKYSDQKLCNIFAFPSGVFDPDKATYANSKEFNKQIITGAVIPELSSLRDDWNEIAKLYKEDIYVDYDLSVYPELQEDLEKMSTALDKIWYLKGNEKRLMIGQDEDDDTPMMKEYLVPSSLVPLSQLGDNYDALLNEVNNTP